MPYIGAVFAYCLKQSRKLWVDGLYLNKEYLAITRREILGMSSTIYNFIKEFEIVFSENARDCRHVYAAYAQWVKDNGQHSVNSKNFWKEIAELVAGYKDCEKKHYRHISWNDDLKKLMFEVYGDSSIFEGMGRNDGECTKVPSFVMNNMN